MSQYTLAGIVSDLHAELVDASTWSGPYEAFAGHRSITFQTRDHSYAKFAIPDNMPSPAVGARVRITFEVLE